MSVQLKQIPLVNGVVVKRPSKNCKSPYVADVIIDGSELMCHSPALGCCGLSDTNSCVLLSKIEKKIQNRFVNIKLNYHIYLKENIKLLLVLTLNLLKK